MVLEAGVQTGEGRGPSPRPRGVPGWLDPLHPEGGVGWTRRVLEPEGMGAVWGERNVCRKLEARAGLDQET